MSCRMSCIRCTGTYRADSFGLIISVSLNAGGGDYVSGNAITAE